METLVLASEYLQNGFSTIPLQPRSKVPLLASWDHYRRIYASNEQIKEWFSNGHAENNIAIVTGKISPIFALDIDGEEASDYFNKTIESLDGLMMKDLRQHSNMLFVSGQVVEIPIS
jgi:hypothetical protein